MKKKKTAFVFVFLSPVSLCRYIGTVAYNWGYMQSAIDNRVAAFSAPASVAIFSDIPFAISTVVLAIIAIVILEQNE